MKIITERRRVTVLSYGLDFQDKQSPGSSLCFDCDADGTLLPFKYPETEANYKLAIASPDRYAAPKVVNFSYSDTEYATGACDVCKHVMQLKSFTNTCEQCGTDYNSSGQRLAPRSQWGEDTGESLGDILRIGHTTS
jgi:hypothetical protein